MRDAEPLARLIGATRRRINQYVSRRLNAHHLKPPRFWVLVNLLETPGSSLRTLAHRLRMDEPSTSRIVASLARRRFVEVREDARDRRRLNLELSPSGRAFARKLAPLAAEVRQGVEAGFTADEKETLRGLLARVAENVDRLEGLAAARAKAARARVSATPAATAEGE